MDNNILADAFETNRKRFAGMTMEELRSKRAWLEVERDCAELMGLHDRYHECDFDLEVVNAILRGIA